MSEKIKTLKDTETVLRELNTLVDNLTKGQATLGDLLFELQNISSAQGGFVNLSRLTGLGRESLYKILSHRGNPQLNTFLEIIRALGLTIKFEKSNQLEFRSLRNVLAHSHPELSKQWCYMLNNNLSPEDVLAGSHAKVWWQCEKANDHVWQAAIANRTNGRGCPMCARRIVVASNSLSNTHPQLVLEWNEIRNGNLTPNDISAGSNKKVWWQCPKEVLHEWMDSPRNRVLGRGCISCSGPWR